MGGKTEWAPEKKAHGLASIMSPQASLATNRTQPRGVSSFLRSSSLRAQSTIKQEASATDTPTPRCAMSLSILITESGFSRIELSFGSSFFFFLPSFCFFFQCRPRKSSKRRGRGEGGKKEGGGGFVPFVLQTNKSGSSPNSCMTVRQLMGCDLTGTPFASMPTAVRFAQTSWMSSRACRQLPNELASLPTFARRARQKSTSACVATRQPVMVIGNTRARSSGEERNACKNKIR